MTAPDPQKPGPVERLKIWLANLLGNEYAPAARIVDRVFGTFLAAVIAKAVSEGVTIPQVSHLAWWHAILFAGLSAAAQLVLSLLAQRTTGTPELMSLVSHTLRAQRDYGRRVLHSVPLRRPQPPARKPSRHADGRGEHEAA